MANKNTKIELPESITLEEEYRKSRTAWMAVLGNAQRAYDELMNDRDIGESLPEFDKLDSAWIRDFISKKVDAVMQSPNTYNARIEAANEWHELEKDLLKKVSQIERLRQIDPEAKIEVKGCYILITNMEELLREKTKFVVPEQYKNYFAMIVEAADRVTRLNAYQVKHGVKNPVQLTGILTMATRPEDFIRSLIFDDNMRKWDEEQKNRTSKFAIANREHQEEMKRLEEQRKKRFEEARAEKIRNGEQVDFGVSIRTIEGNLIPVGKS